MIHPDDGALRRYCDEPDALDDAQRAHVESCPACGARLTAIRADAAFAVGILGTADAKSFPGTASDDLTSAWSAVRERSRDAHRRIPYGPWLAAAAAVAAIVGIFGFTPAGTLAKSFLTIFQPQQFVAVPVSRADLGTLPDLRSFGTVVARTTPHMREVAGPAQAAAAAHFAVELPHWLPTGLPHGARYAVTSGSDTAFTFNAAKAWANIPPQSRTALAMPRDLDGAVLEVATRPAVIIAFGSALPPIRSAAHAEDAREHRRARDADRGDLPPLIIVQAPLPTVKSSGATVAQIEDYLLRQPGISPALAAEIRAIGDPDTTMPVLIPIDRAFGQPVTVQGVTGLGIGDNTGVGGFVLWQRGGTIFAVAGKLRQRDILNIAESLR